MKFLKILAIIFLVLFGLFMAFAPTEIDVNESIEIEAHPDVVYAQFNNVENFQAWSPWKKADPTMEITLGDKIEGVGANYSWISDEMGKGSFKIAEAEKNKSQVQEISMMGGEPFNARFDMESLEDGKVKLSWSMKNEIGFMDLGGRMFGFVAPVMLSESFKNGLSDIKIIAEKIGMPFTSMVEAKELSSINIIYIRDSCEINSEAMKAAYTRCYTELGNYMAQHEMEMAGMPMAIAVQWTPDENKYVFDAAFPVSDKIELEEGHLKSGMIDGGNYVVCSHKGSYEYLEKSHEQIHAYCQENGLEITGMPYEIYENDPENVGEYELLTTIAYPVKS